MLSVGATPQLRLWSDQIITVLSQRKGSAGENYIGSAIDVNSFARDKLPMLFIQANCQYSILLTFRTGSVL